MTTELTFLTWVLILTIVQIALAATFRTREVGLPYNATPRDTPSPMPVGIITGRLIRAQNNLLETLPLFIGAVLIAHVAQIHTTLTYWGAALYFWARVAYVPLYAFGVPYVRTLAWGISLAGLVMLLLAILHLA